MRTYCGLLLLAAWVLVRSGGLYNLRNDVPMYFDTKEQCLRARDMWLALAGTYRLQAVIREPEPPEPVAYCVENEEVKSK
jgi:hypothetical protein